MKNGDFPYKRFLEATFPTGLPAVNQIETSWAAPPK